ncbi:MAG: Beta-carotene ketolase, partial [uncultured Thermomicrobiales bacterium]
GAAGERRFRRDRGRGGPQRPGGGRIPGRGRAAGLRPRAVPRGRRRGDHRGADPGVQSLQRVLRPVPGAAPDLRRTRRVGGGDRADRPRPALFRPVPGRVLDDVLERLRTGQGRDRQVLDQGRRRLRPLRRLRRARLRGDGRVRVAPPAVVVRGRVPVPDRRRGAGVPEVLPRVGGGHRRVLLRKPPDAGRGRRLRDHRHLSRAAGTRHRLRQALPLDGHGDRPARFLGLRPGGDGRRHPGARDCLSQAGGRHPDECRGGADLGPQRAGGRRRAGERRGDRRRGGPLQRRPQTDLPRAGRRRGLAGRLPDLDRGDQDRQPGVEDQPRALRVAALHRAQGRRAAPGYVGWPLHRADDRLHASRLRGGPRRPPGDPSVHEHPRPVRGRSDRGPARPTRDLDLRPVFPLPPGRGDLGRAAGGDRRCGDRRVRPLRAKRARIRAGTTDPGATGHRGPVRPDRRPHLPRRTGAGAGLRFAPGARFVILRRADRRSVPLRLGCLAGRLRDGRAGAQRGPGGDRAVWRGIGVAVGI